MRTLFALLLAGAALFGAPKPIYRWKDKQGRIQVTQTPPPPGAVLLDAPPPPALESADRSRLIVRQSQGPVRRLPAHLSASQQEAWAELGRFMEGARAGGNHQALESIASSLIRDSLWGSGLAWVALIPILTPLLALLLGWWLSFGLPRGHRSPLVACFGLGGVLSAQLLVSHFLFRPQSQRLAVNVRLLTEHYLGQDRALSPGHKQALLAHYDRLEHAARPRSWPWRFYQEVGQLEDTLKQVLASP